MEKVGFFESGILSRMFLLHTNHFADAVLHSEVIQWLLLGPGVIRTTRDLTNKIAASSHLHQGKSHQTSSCFSVLCSSTELEVTLCSPC